MEDVGPTETVQRWAEVFTPARLPASSTTRQHPYGCRRAAVPVGTSVPVPRAAGASGRLSWLLAGPVSCAHGRRVTSCAEWLRRRNPFLPVERGDGIAARRSAVVCSVRGEGPCVSPARAGTVVTETTWCHRCLVLQQRSPAVLRAGFSSLPQGTRGACRWLRGVSTVELVGARWPPLGALRPLAPQASTPCV